MWMETLTREYDTLCLEEIFSSKQDVLTKLKERFLSYLQPSENDADLKERWEYLLKFGIASLRIFLMENWTGPLMNEGDIPDKAKPFFSEEFNELVFADLQCDEEEIQNLCKRVGCFWIAYTILIRVPELAQLKAPRLWILRCLATYQNIVEEKSNSIYERFEAVAESGYDDHSETDSEVQVQFHLECAHMYLKYYGYSKAKAHLERSRELLNIDVTLAGVPGKRTRFQEKELAQLRLEVKISDHRDAGTLENIRDKMDNLPKDVLLDNDTLLPKIEFSEEDAMPYLKPIEQAYILSLCILLEKTRPKDNILVEQLHPYIQAALRDPQTWTVQSKALYARSLLESQKSRTVERSMMQMESLVREHHNMTPQADDRIYLLHAVDLPPSWVYEASLAQILVSLGCTKAALEIFERINAWDDVIECYQRLGRHEKAENVIRSELQKHETGKLWCLLGDVTKDIVYYEKAWEFSKRRNARSQRSLGYWYLRSGKLQECIPYFKNSLEVSSLQPQVWFSLGCAAMATGQSEIAQNAFQRSVTIEPDNHQAWNNLANVFIRTKQKHKAFKALQEALKANFRSWQIWENFILVTIDIGEFNETIRAFHNLIELKRKEIDTEVLRILVGAVTSDIKDAHDNPASSLASKTKELFGRICAQVTNNADVWLLYGDLYGSGNEPEDKEKALQNYIKANRCFMQTASWEKDPSKLGLVIEVCNKLIKVTLKIISSNAKESRDVQIISSTKMAVANFLKRFEIVYPDGDVTGTDGGHKDELGQLREDFEQLCNLLN